MLTLVNAIMEEARADTLKVLKNKLQAQLKNADAKRESVQVALARDDEEKCVKKDEEEKKADEEQASFRNFMNA